MRGALRLAGLLYAAALALLPLAAAVCGSLEDACTLEIGALFPSAANGDEDGFLVFETGQKKYVRFVVSALY
jgi:hypothetical protein